MLPQWETRRWQAFFHDRSFIVCHICNTLRVLKADDVYNKGEGWKPPSSEKSASCLSMEYPWSRHPGHAALKIELCTYTHRYLCHSNGKACLQMNYSISPQIMSQCKCLPGCVMQTCAHSLLGSAILHQPGTQRKKSLGWLVLGWCSSQPLITSPRVCSLQMPLGTREVVSREPEIKIWMLGRLLCQVWALLNVGGEEMEAFQGFAKVV